MGRVRWSAKAACQPGVVGDYLRAFVQERVLCVVVSDDASGCDALHRYCTHREHCEEDEVQDRDGSCELSTIVRLSAHYASGYDW